MKRMKRIGLLLAAMLLVQSCLVPAAMAAEPNTYSGKNNSAAEMDDPQYWTEMHRGEMDNTQLEAVGVDHSWFTPRDLKKGETLRKGIDVAQFQGKIDWAKVKASGIDFAFIRVGYRGWGTGNLGEDSRVYENLKGAIDSGIQVGVYIYSQAITEKEAQEEAQYVLKRIRNYAITLPVVIDFEFADGADGRRTGRLYQANLSKSQATAVCNAFLAEVTAAGYRGAVYANMEMLEKHLNAKQLDGAVWLAHYASKTSYSGSHEFWQCTSSGYVAGISDQGDPEKPQNVDLDYWYDSGISALPFRDVATSRWSYADICQAYERGLIAGTSATQFEPEGTTTRGQLAAILYRLNGSPKVSGSSTFTDLTEDYYRDAITWAQQNQIIMGVGGTQFAPNDAITRQDLTAMLYRLAGLPETEGSLSQFKDAARVSDYAQTAMAWAVENGLIVGDNGNLMPRSTATREQTVAILMRYIRYAGL